MGPEEKLLAIIENLKSVKTIAATSVAPDISIELAENSTCFSRRCNQTFEVGNRQYITKTFNILLLIVFHS